MRIDRWSARLLNFNYKIQYKPGLKNVTADCLSRLPLPAATDTLEEDIEVVALTDDILSSTVSAADFKQACLTCPVQEKLRDILQSKWPNSEKKVSPDLQPYYRIRHELSLVDDYVVRGSHRLLVPETLREKFIQLAHESHQGIVRAKQRLRELYWWPAMDADVVTAIHSCVTCQNHDKTAITHTPPLQPVPFPDSAWEKLAIDIVGPFTDATIDCRFAITLIDYYSKRPEIAFVSHITSATVITFLSTVFSREGNPKELISDNGPQFVSSEFEFFLRERNIVHRKSSVYYPQANGEIERFNRSLKEVLQTANLTGKSWKAFTTEFLHNYRATCHATTQASPAELLHGRQMRTKLHVADIKFPQHALATKSSTADIVKRQQAKCKAYTDRKRGAREVHFQPGSLVRVKKPGLLKQGQSKFTTPLEVRRQRGPYTYELSDGRIWNASRLAPVRHDLAEVPFDEGHIPTPDITCDRPEQSEPIRRPERNRKQPAWTKDYVM
uniref:Gypsy retrotransposon integrase-like protein 1 n=1 Tax=Xenopus tropicalis TaxID=8364 RepID=A0A803K669_XENTR